MTGTVVCGLLCAGVALAFGLPIDASVAVGTIGAMLGEWLALRRESE